MPDLRALELLVVVARTGSLSAAAAELGITQQAASSRIRMAEALVGAGPARDLVQWAVTQAHPARARP